MPELESPCPSTRAGSPCPCGSGYPRSPSSTWLGSWTLFTLGPVSSSPWLGTQVCLFTCAHVLYTHPCKQHPPPHPLRAAWGAVGV